MLNWFFKKCNLQKVLSTLSSNDCEISKAGLLSCLFSMSILCPALASHPPVPRIVFYVSRRSVCVFNKVTFRCFLLRRIIYPHHSFTPNNLSQKFLRGNHYVFLQLPLRKHVLQSVIFRHGPVGLVVKRWLVWVPQNQRILSALSPVSGVLSCSLSSTLQQGNCEGGNGS